MKSLSTTHFGSSKPADIYDGHESEVGDDDEDDDDNAKVRHQTTMMWIKLKWFDLK